MNRKILIRVIHAWLILTPIAITFIRDRRKYILFGGPRKLTPEQRRQRARKLTNDFERLGTTYIKLAQFLTTRPDFVPPVYIEEMQKLQDEVEPAPFRDIEDMIREDIGDIDTVFEYFDEEAISGASIAQVHRARIDGEEVAVKIRRPGLEQVVEADLWVLSKITPLVTWFLRRMGQESHAESLQSITDELRKTLQEEINFLREAQVMNEVREDFRDAGISHRVIVPEVYEQYTTTRILTMKFEDGIKVKYPEKIKAKGHDLTDIVDAITEAYLYMAFVYDVFQADPHQGNIAVNNEGQVVIYDYGIAQRPDPHQQKAFTDLFVGIGLENPSMVVDAFIEMGAINPSTNRETIYQVAELMIRDITGDEITDNDIQQIESRVDETLHDYPLKLPQEVILGMRATFGVEGLCARMDPEYDFSEKLYHFFVENGEVDIVEIAAEYEYADGFLPDFLVEMDEFLGHTTLFKARRPILEFIYERTNLMDFIENGAMNGKAETHGSNPNSGEVNHFISNSELTEDIKEHMGEEMRKNSKRNTLALLGASMILSGVFLYTANSLLYIPVILAGVISFLLVRSSLKDRSGVLGPKYIATRHRMEQWDKEQEAQEVEFTEV